MSLFSSPRALTSRAGNNIAQRPTTHQLWNVNCPNPDERPKILAWKVRSLGRRRWIDDAYWTRLFLGALGGVKCRDS